MKGIVRTDNMSGTRNGAKLCSVKYYVSTTPTAIENGRVVKVEGLLSGETDIRKAIAPSAGTAKSLIALIASVEVDKNKKYTALGGFENAAGAIARGYFLDEAHQFFAVSPDCVDVADGVTVAAGKVVELQASTKLKITNSLTQDSTQIGTVYAIENGLYVIETC